MLEIYDFIIVGGGTAGCLLASRLAKATAKPSVLLLEAGGDNKNLLPQAPADRYLPVFTRPELQHGYFTTRQETFNGKELTYCRGKGLGGSSVINFMGYYYGPSAEYERWAELVGDDAWGWENVRDRFKRLETYNVNVPKEVEAHANPLEGDHGYDGPIAVTLPTAVEPEFTIMMDAAKEIGLLINLDVNSGNPIGVCVDVSTSNGTVRTSSLSAFLSQVPWNLTIWTDAVAAKLLFAGIRVLGVQLLDDRKAPCSQEVIITAGSIDTPKLLFLSGTGPAAKLAALDIQVIQDLPGVGKNFQDHQEAARKEWAEKKTGPLNITYSNISTSFLKLPSLLSSPEFLTLDPSPRAFLTQPTVPHFEIVAGGPNFLPDYDFGSDAYSGIIATGHNLASRGQITLSSSNPRDAPIIEPNYCTHPFDKRVMIEDIRAVMRYLDAPSLKRYVKEHIVGPKSDSEEDILDLLATAGAAGLHAAGTVKMGRADDHMACVDTEFRVYGVEGLRVADLSVVPFVTSNHTQATAYLIAETAAEKIDNCWGLDVVVPEGDVRKGGLG